ncbi:MAG: hypothetical protein A2X25_14930 [Chloroflexi bacterium GWB2_49_20]|nr:MAG: hypothetical protein A2X25_14930 [Chloroflexi bacterium GWB2_49_20]OGN80429.1 MAG: hypothetical protein A2X26_12675 [Chloroflexi bacterium GWC2_49_37]OGN84253.1 MAG: hypothetical protein A2X27_12475 [Chloroflexi bacterium GWD2_49_16]
MTVEFDLIFLPFHRIDGKDWPSLPGLMTASPPRRVARGREGDHLFIYLALAGNTPFSSDEYTKIIAQMTAGFFETAGSLTSALRITADILNLTLLNRNLGTTGRGQYIVGRLILGVLRGSQLVVVQSGPTHIFSVGKDDVQHIHDPELSGRGLGFSQTAPLYYSQLDLNPGDQLVMCAQLPDGWEAALMSERGVTSLEALRRKLQSIPNENINAAIIQAQTGKGLMTLLSAARLQAVQTPVAALQETPASMLVSELDVELDMEELRAQEEQSRQSLPPLSGPVAKAPAELENTPAPEAAILTSAPVPADESIRIPSHYSQLLKDSTPEDSSADEMLPESELDGSAGVSPAIRQMAQSQIFSSNNTSELPEIKRTDLSRRVEIMGRLLTGLQGVRKFGRSVSTGFQTLIKRTLPGVPEDRSPAMQGSTMAFIAVIVPLILVVIASTVYLRFGRSAQYDENYKLAISEAVGAIGQSDSAIVRRAWESTLYYLDRAEGYQITQDSYALRQQAQSVLDAMDQIIRLDFRPAIYGGLSKTIQVGHMAASETDLYLLNVAQGNVMRTFMTSQGYEVDTNFKCGPGSYQSINVKSESTYDVGIILDMVALPRVNLFGAATLVGMDNTGTLVFCSPNKEPLAWKLEEPDIRWKNLAGFALGADDYSLYVLDPAGNAVWVFGLDEDTRYGLPPDLFFSGDFVPKNLGQATDITISGNDLYLLFSDGHVTNCTPGILGDVVPIRCNDPETMTDTRSGHQSGAVLSDAQFTEMTFTSPPDPSLYVLAPVTAAIYRFSPRPEALFLQNQFRAAVDQDKTLFTSPISAMAISPNRYIFLSVGSQIYFATDVP